MRKPILILTALVPLTMPSPGQAQPSQLASGWTLDLSVYSWATAVTGTTGAGPLQVKIDNSAIDTIRQSDSLLSFMARGELRRGRLGFFLDGEYSDLGYDDVRLGPARVDATSVIGMLEFGAAYEMAGGRFGRTQDFPWAVDLLGGGRWMHLHNKISIVQVSTTKSTTDWVDPFAGARLRGRLGERWEYILRGDIGGGIGGSRFAWQVVSTIGYRFTMFGLESTALLGYRALSQDYESAKLVYDTTMHGPVIGLNIRF
ncbi:hypothetical protein [Roseicella sp. DB1501]|uniref:hypothetical protein n=1 Tax=Roseicella sp. DB1501 TaxID=2730925 RepID=UPI001492E39F|nr:hypothetical protein [Roseicella sp. DB1501]NOG69110.1 hypothetical protein [Roseicella sp. DB1501]